jgi:transcriptional regulator with XRE-family HTH domain
MVTYMEPTDTHEAAGLGRRVKVARINAGLTQYELGAAAGVSREYITRIENGRSTPSPRRITLIAQACKVRREEIAGAVLVP